MTKDNATAQAEFNDKLDTFLRENLPALKASFNDTDAPEPDYNRTHGWVLTLAAFAEPQDGECLGPCIQSFLCIPNSDNIENTTAEQVGRMMGIPAGIAAYLYCRASDQAGAAAGYITEAALGTNPNNDDIEALMNPENYTGLANATINA
jgi:hypothetical protein